VIVSVPAECGGEPGVYLVSRDGQRERFAGPKQPSLRPLDVEG
jgi:hypothetical protein